MGQKDIISKQSIKRIAVDIAIYLLDLDIDPNDVELLATEQQRVEDRRADLVVKLKLKDNQTFILHVEIQNNNDKQMPLRMMRYYTDIAFAYPQLPIKQYVIYIGKTALKMAAVIENEDWQYCYKLIDIHSVDCQSLIERDNPDALILAILCDFNGRDEQDMVNHIMLRLHQLLEDDPKQFREYLCMLDVLAENRNLQQYIEKAGEMLTQIAIEKTGFYQLGEKRGEIRGEKRGEIRGEKRGEIRGEQRSEIRTLQNSIINILSTRFQQVPESIKNNLLAIKDVALLNRLLIKTISISKAEYLFDD